MRTLELPTQEDWVLLGISPTDKLSTAKHKYRQAARACHPDVPSGDAVRFREASDAFRRIWAALEWRDAHGLASAASIEDEEAGEFDEALDPDVDDWGAQGGTDVYATTPWFERFVRKLGRAAFLSGRFPEREWSTLATLAASMCLALVVHADVHPAWLAYSLASLVLSLAVGRIVSLPSRLGL